MRAVVAVPPISDFYFTAHRMSSLGARTVAAILKKIKCETTLLDFPAMKKKHVRVDIPENLDYLSTYLIPQEYGPVSFFTGYYRRGPSLQSCAEQVLEGNPDILFISCFAYAYAEDARNLAEHINAINPDLPIVLGGAGASVCPEYFLRNPSIDFVLTGEAECCLPQFIKAFLENIEGKEPDFDAVPNLRWKKNNRIHVPKRTLKTSSADLDLIWTEVRSGKKRTWISTSLSRGCAKECLYCTSYLCHGRGFRAVPPERIEDKLKHLPQVQFLHINLEDDNILVDKHYCFAVLKILSHAGGQVTFSMENGLDVDFLDLSTVGNLINAGLRRFNISIGSMDALEDMRHVESIVKYFHLRKMPVITYFICGLENDSVDRVVRNLRFLYRIPTQIGISLFYPVPGMPAFERNRLIYSSPRLCLGSSAYPWTNTLTTGQMVTAFRLARLLNFLKKNRYADVELKLLKSIQREKCLMTIVQRENSEYIEEVPEMDPDMVRRTLEGLI